MNKSSGQDVIKINPNYVNFNNIKDLQNKYEELEERLSQLETEFMYRPEGELVKRTGEKWTIEEKKKIIGEN